MHFSIYTFQFAIILLLLAGCHRASDPTTSSSPGGPNAAATSSQYREELLTYAIDNLNRIEEFSSSDVLEQILQRLNPRNGPQQQEIAGKGDALLSAWPEPEMQRQIVDRLKQWIRTQQPPAEWKLDPMVAALPKELAALPLVRGLDKMEFCRFDGYALQEAVWTRDVSQWARGDTLDDLERARSLFDWTVRNIQLEAETPGWIPQFPWETLLFGRGTATERAWVFILLARQQGIDAALLALPGERGLRPWCVAVLIESNAYLFDPALGLPIPAPNGVTRDGAGQLVVQPATLAQVAADDGLLRRLDADEKHPYRVESSELKHVVVLLEASPTYLARRMQLVESRLAGPQKMVLAAAPTAQAAHWKAAKLTDVQLWLQPFATIQRRSHLTWEDTQMRLLSLLPFYMVYEDRSTSQGKQQDPQAPRQQKIQAAPLGKGRMLYLKGRFVGQDGANQYFQLARPSNEELAAIQRVLVEETRRAAEQAIQNLSPEERNAVESQIEAKAAYLARAQMEFFLQAKQAASYWSGLIAYQRGNYSAAGDYFRKRTLEAAPNTPWRHGALYNLARTYEAAGDTQRAILQYQSDASSPGYQGDLLRAKWLGEAKVGGKGKGGGG